MKTGRRSGADGAMAWLAAAILCVLAGHASAQGSGAADREALEALYHVTDGPHWSNRVNWLSAAPLSEWFGVGTDESGRVTVLYLPGNKLNGEIPPELGRLSQLQELLLWGNPLRGPIPFELGNLSNLSGTGFLQKPTDGVHST